MHNLLKLFDYVVEPPESNILLIFQVIFAEHNSFLPPVIILKLSVDEPKAQLFEVISFNDGVVVNINKYMNTCGGR